jgi:uncharacterized protein with HEPN domain
MAMRNKIIHEYFGIGLQAVWVLVKEDLNQLKPKIESIKNLS